MTRLLLCSIIMFVTISTGCQSNHDSSIKAPPVPKDCSETFKELLLRSINSRDSNDIIPINKEFKELHDILGGATYRMLLEDIASNNIPLRFQACHYAKLYSSKEEYHLFILWLKMHHRDKNAIQDNDWASFLDKEMLLPENTNESR